jgi:hypothetical protein
VGCPMIWMLPVVLVALALMAMTLQRRATAMFGVMGNPHDRHNHSICPHLVTRRSLQHLFGGRAASARTALIKVR